MNQIFAQLFYEMEKHRDTVLVTLIADRGYDSAAFCESACNFDPLDGRIGVQF